MKLYDISLPVHPGLIVWPGDAGVSLDRVSSIDAGDAANVSQLSCGVHSGTHIDAPLHFLRAGAAIHELDLSSMIGAAAVVELEQAQTLDRDVLEDAGIPPGTSRLLLKTRNSAVWDDAQAEFSRDYVAVDRSGAGWLVDAGVELVGIDYLSIAPWGEIIEPHQILLSAGVVIIEGLDLRQVPGGTYELLCLPLKLVGSDGAPARVVLRSLEQS